MKLKDCVTPGLVTVSADESLRSAAEKMANQDIGILPVQNANQLVGVITDRDIACRGVAQGLNPAETPVREVMTEGILCVDEDADISQAVKAMEERQVRRIFATNNDGKIVGICSFADLALKCSDEHLQAEALQEVSKPNTASANL